MDFLLAYIFNEPRIAIDSEIRLGHFIAGTQRDFNILFMPVFFMSLFILILRPLTTQLAILWKNKELKNLMPSLRRCLSLFWVSAWY